MSAGTMIRLVTTMRRKKPQLTRKCSMIFVGRWVRPTLNIAEITKTGTRIAERVWKKANIVWSI